jgi:glycosyltransferase involved in cell wall biosynthesis
MCTYNAEKFLWEQLQSILCQTRLPDEVVIYDDASEDSTRDLLASFADSAPFPVSVAYNPNNLGYVQNFTRAMNACTGDVILLSDQDDCWHPSRTQRVEELFDSDREAGGIFTNGFLMNGGSELIAGDLWGSFDFGSADQRRVRDGDPVPVLIKRNVVTGMAFAFRREFCRVMEMIPEHWPHDAWLALMIASEGRLSACPEMLVTYRVHDKQQIGVPITRSEKIRFIGEKGIGRYLALSRERNLEEYSKEASQYHALLRAAEKYPDLRHRWWFPMAEAKAEHAARGVKLLQLGRFKRMSQVLRNWREYRRYSPTGASAFWRDLVV